MEYLDRGGGGHRGGPVAVSPLGHCDTHLPVASSAGVCTTRGGGSAGVPIGRVGPAYSFRGPGYEIAHFPHRRDHGFLGTCAEPWLELGDLCDNGALSKGLALTCHGSDGPKGGPPMSGTHPRPALTTYRDAVTELMESGERFGDVEDAIDEVANLTRDERAALWLFAFSLRDPIEQQLDAQAYLSSLGQ